MYFTCKIAIHNSIYSWRVHVYIVEVLVNLLTTAVLAHIPNITTQPALFHVICEKLFHKSICQHVVHVAYGSSFVQGCSNCFPTGVLILDMLVNGHLDMHISLHFTPLYRASCKRGSSNPCTHLVPFFNKTLQAFPAHKS